MIFWSAPIPAAYILFLQTSNAKKDIYEPIQSEILYNLAGEINKYPQIFKVNKFLNEFSNREMAQYHYGQLRNIT